MTTSFGVPVHTLTKQHRASDPATSVWVSANAGSGKTHVLTQRVVRLLLEGIAPSRILCLTFTKAAAANMSARVFDTLARWTRLGDGELRAAIIATGAQTPARADLSEARKLFARTVETPGGLKIQTIHAFCEKLLHLFPFEANVPSRFEVADEARQAEVLARARHETLAEGGVEGGRLHDALLRVSDECDTESFEKLITGALSHRAFLSGAFGPGDLGRSLRKLLGLAAGRDLDAVEQEMIEGGLSPERLVEIIDFLEGGKATDMDRAALLRGVVAADHSRKDRLSGYLSVFFTDKGEGTPFKSLVTKDLAKARPGIVEDLNTEQQRLDRLRDERKALATFERTRALLDLVEAILARYGAMKSLRGLLDFDDLVGRSLALLERSEASWVLYKLDQGIDHVLVDEAQDTSPEQWKILDCLTAEFSAGSAGAARTRTFFAVGDEKQSIFSFQGAAPHMFGAMRRSFEARFVASGEQFVHVHLTHSFRSLPGVLAAVDTVFGCPEHQRGLVDADIWMPHEALKGNWPGLVEIWPPATKKSDEAPSDWRLPLDVLDTTDPASLVAERVAQKIGLLLYGPTAEYVLDTRTGRPRPVTAADILILVRTRGPFFEAVIRALKQNKIPVAGADRLELPSHIAVMDLVAAGRAALLPQDDLTLACVLKSPLIGLDDDDLLAIAPDRSASLFDALATSAEPRHGRACAEICRWHELRGLGPFAFYSRLLGEGGGRLALQARLGAEACDAIDEFLRLALAFETDAAPSLVAFLDMVETMTGSLKRDMETGAPAVRVMTVHAAKGLEAKIVFLPDTCGVPTSHHDPKLFLLGDEDAGTATLAWSPRKDCDCGPISVAREEARRAAEDEYRRLLYVALTRAEERLYIAGFHGSSEPNSASWAAMISSTLTETDGMVAVPAFWNPEEKVLRRVSGERIATDDFATDRAGPSQAANETLADLPAWLRERPAPEPTARPLLRPSSGLASADHVRADDSREDNCAALHQGRLTHALLQYLPNLEPSRRRDAALAYIASADCGLSEQAREDLFAVVEGVLALPSLAALFGPRSRAEVAIAGTVALPSGARVEISGRIDRLGETDDEVFAADFKTGAAPREVAATPLAHLSQMALYRGALRPLWPHKRVRMLLIWTEGPLVVPLDDDRLDEALAQMERRM